jgi:BirA family biotin operon repressor/biotin-[acetyl-CoA-carboxylase] ligase
LRRLDELADQLNDDDGRSALLATYRSRCVTLGENVRVERAGDVITGMAAAIDDDGQLVVVDDTGHSHTVAVGDVVHVRATA